MESGHVEDGVLRCDGPHQFAAVSVIGWSTVVAESKLESESVQMGSLVEGNVRPDHVHLPETTSPGHNQPVTTSVVPLRRSIRFLDVQLVQFVLQMSLVGSEPNHCCIRVHCVVRRFKF